MFKTSHLQELKRRYREMYASSEEGTDELVDQYKKETPGQKEDTDKDKPGTQGDQAEYQKKRKEIAKKFGVDACAQLKDEDKKKACFAALDASHVSDDEEEDEDDDPVGKNEEKNYDYDGKVVKISKKNFRKVHKDYKNSTKGKERMLILDPKTQGSISVPVKFTEEVELNEGGDQIWFKGIGMTFDEFSLIFATMYVPGSRVLPTEVAPDNSKYGSLLKKLSRKDQKWVVSLLKDYMKRGGVVHKDVVKNFVLKEEVELGEATQKVKGGHLGNLLKNVPAGRKYKFPNGDVYTSTGKGKFRRPDGSEYNWIGLGAIASSKFKNDTIVIESVELGETVELQIVMALDDVGIVATEITDKEVTVKKKEVKKAEAALKKSFKGKKVPKVIGEERIISAYDKIKGLRNKMNESFDHKAAVELKQSIENGDMI